ncbi:MAG: FAD-dependent oxidoreductase, partial [Caldisericia bacterium]|nr:FAD-dependent oxidoreductase [Caldisericia bacterium]
VCDILIIGGGPAGLCAASVFENTDTKVLLIERDPFLGGQLLKQTHMFFGSKEQYAGVRGFKIAETLQERLENSSNITIMKETVASGYYPEENFLLALEKDKNLHRIFFKKVIVATGASEKTLLFENNDLPGIFGAGAVQTLMNMYGVLPGKEIVMIGSGNIGLIVSYQLMQAGVKVKLIVEAAPTIGGYFVHAAKIRRLGIPILTKTTVKRAFGKNSIDSIELVSIDDKWQPIPGTERIETCDTLCLAVGLVPLSELLSQMNCKMKYVPALGGSVAVRNKRLQCTNKSVYIAGDVAGIEEASSAMLEGYIAGASACEDLNIEKDGLNNLKTESYSFLRAMRSGAFGEKIRVNLQKVEK